VSRTRAAFDRIWPRAAIVILLLVVWWAAAASGIWSHRVLPGPGDVWSALTSNLGGPQGLLIAAERSVIRLFVGLLVAVAVGTPVGMAMAGSRIVQRSIGSVIVGLQALPPIAWLPLAIVWLGFTERAVVFVVIAGTAPAVAIGTASALRLVAPSLVRTGRTLGARGWRLYSRVVLPAAVPGYVAALEQAWAIAWRALLAAEILRTGARGLGHFIFRAGHIFEPTTRVNTPLVLATMAVIIVVGLAIDFLLALVDRRVRERRGLVVA
jgi:NitT/TauT family transport system permease protein